MTQPVTPITIRIPARSTAVLLSSIAIFLAVQSIVTRYFDEHFDPSSQDLLYKIMRAVNINRESSIPTWYATALLLACAVIFAVIAVGKSQQAARFRRYWWSLAGLFVFLSLDEASALHEKFTIPLQNGVGATGYFYFAWTLIGIPLALIVGLIYLRFVLHLPPRARNGFIIAGILYLGGALVIESISANMWYVADGTTLAYSAVGTLEELCEMLGVIVLLYSILIYLSTEMGTVQVDIQVNEVSPITSLSHTADARVTRFEEVMSK